MSESLTLMSREETPVPPRTPPPAQADGSGLSASTPARIHSALERLEIFLNPPARVMEFIARATIPERRRRKAQIVEDRGGVCVDCRLSWPLECFQFDHLPGYKKVANVTTLLASNKKKLEAEVAKCDLVCANCHAIRTAARNRDLSSAKGPLCGCAYKNGPCERAHRRIGRPRTAAARVG